MWVLVFLSLYCGVAAWLPWSAAGGPPVPGWAVRFRLDRPFSSPAFLAGVLALFLSTLACTWSRTPGFFALWWGRARGYGVGLPGRSGESLTAFLDKEGFGKRPGARFRFRHALLGGFVLHLGLLFLILGVIVQQGWQQSGAFELAEGETLRLRQGGATFAREQGPFAPEHPPDLAVTLVRFDAFLHQPGYAPDRASQLRVARPGMPVSETVLDRAEGWDLGDLTLYQAIPVGLALTVALEGLGTRSFHLRDAGRDRARGEFASPDGTAHVFVVRTERPLGDPLGTGALQVFLESGGTRRELPRGEPFPFGRHSARVLSVNRWAGFTFTRAPGLSGVFAGFALVLAGAALLTFPAGVAEPPHPGEDVAGWIYVTRGREALLEAWSRFGDERGVSAG